MVRWGRWVLVATLAASAVGRLSAQTGCDRMCLRTTLDQYLAAVVAHDPKAVPLAAGFRQTENAINVAPGHAQGPAARDFRIIRLDPVLAENIMLFRARLNAPGIRPGPTP